MDPRGAFAQREVDVGEFDNGLHGDLPLNDAPSQTPGFFRSYRLFGRWLQILTAVTVMFWGASAQAGQLRILAFGDSLTAGAGVKAEDSLPAQLKARLLVDGFDIEIINAGVSGDTTAMGLDRLDYTLSAGPVDLAIVELGANDMLTGVDPGKTRANLDQIVAALRSKGVNVMLAAMVSSANWGQAYKQDFDSIYPDLAKKHGVTMIPFFLEGVWGHPALLVDGVHPNAAGVAKVVSKIAPQIEKVLTSMGATRVARPQ